MSEKLLSVIIPVYGVENYLKKCVDSVIGQTYKNIEIILVDDGSPDNCPAICDEYAEKHKNIKVIHKENGGQGSARNAGLDIAQGEYIGFVDSDDYIEPDMYEVMIEALERTGSDISFCRLKTHSGLHVAESVGYTEEHVFENAEELLKGFFKGNAAGFPVNKVYKKELFSDIRFPNLRAREDIYIMHELYGKCNKAVHTGKCLYDYVIRENSTENQKFSAKYLVSIEIADIRREYIAKNFPTLKPLADRSCYGARISAVRKIVRANAEREFRDTLKKLKEYLKTKEPCDKEQKKSRREILYFPCIFKFKMWFEYSFRKRVKSLLLRLKKTQ